MSLRNVQAAVVTDRRVSIEWPWIYTDEKIKQLLQCGSRYLSETEKRYPTREIEMLAIVWSIRKCNI